MRTAENAISDLEEIFFAAMAARDSSGALLVARGLCRTFSNNLKAGGANPERKIAELIMRIAGFSRIAFQENMPGVARAMYAGLTEVGLELREKLPSALTAVVERYRTDTVFFAESDDPFQLFFLTEVLPAQLNQILEGLNPDSPEFQEWFADFSVILITLCRAKKIEAAFRGLTVLGNFAVTLERFKTGAGKDQFLQHYLTYISAVAREAKNSAASGRLTYAALIVIGAVRSEVLSRKWWIIWNEHIRLCLQLIPMANTSENLRDGIANEAIDTLRLLASEPDSSEPFLQLVKSVSDLFMQVASGLSGADQFVQILRLAVPVRVAAEKRNTAVLSQLSTILQSLSGQIQASADTNLKERFKAFAFAAAISIETNDGAVRTVDIVGPILALYSGGQVSSNLLIEILRESKLFNQDISREGAVAALERIARARRERQGP